MMMSWPWGSRRTSDEHLVVGSTPDTLSWLLADAGGRVHRCGLETRGDEPPADFARRIRALGLPTRQVAAVLDLPDAQLLQIDTPAVKPEEMKSAARWRIKDLIDVRLDEVTLDVMHVGDAQARSKQKQLFVVAARNALIQGLSRRLQASGLELSVIDVAEIAQRNLLGAAAAAAGLASRATAALMRHGDQALLTICAQGELYYARRLDWDDSGLAPASPTPAALAESIDAMDMAGLDFVDYGAADAAIDDVGAPRLVVEVQRSFDLWERSWPDLPLAGMWVHADDATDLLIAQLAPALLVPVQAMAPDALFPGYAEAATTPALRRATLPLVGALQRFTASA